MKEPSVSPRESYHHGDLRRALLDAALAVVVEAGPGALSLRDVARRAGVSHNAPYRHFTDKAALVAALAEEGFRLLTAAMRAEAERRGPRVQERFLGLAVAYVAFAIGQPGHFRVMFGQEAADKDRYPQVMAAEREAFDGCVQAIADCQREGEVRPGDPQHFALAAWSLVHGLAGLHVDGLVAMAGLGGASPEAVTVRMARTLFAGLAEGGNQKAGPGAG
jgi:AcrR family transcriptional regulator